MPGKKGYEKVDDTPVAIAVSTDYPFNSGAAVVASPIDDLPSRAEERRRKKANETIIAPDAMDVGFMTWMCLSMDGDGGDGGDDEAMLACCVVILFVAAAAVVATTAPKMASAVYRTFKRSDDSSADEVVNCLEDLNRDSATDDQKCIDLYDFVDAVRKSHHTGWFSSTRTSKDFDLRKELCGPDELEKTSRANPTNLITYLKKEGTFAKYTNNGRSLFNETIFKGRGEVVIQKIRKMTSEEQSSLINTIVSKYKSVGCFSSVRSKQLFGQLQQEGGNQIEKIKSIVSFIRDTDKKQRMYQAIMDAYATNQRVLER